MLNEPTHRQVHTNLTVRKIPEGIAESHLGIEHRPSSHMASMSRRDGMKMMRADWCADVSKAITGPERRRCQSFMSTFCRPTPGGKEVAGTAAAQSLCAKFYAAFHLGGPGATGNPALWHFAGSALSPAPVQPVSPAPPPPVQPEAEEVESASPAPADEVEAEELAVGKHRLDGPPVFEIKNFAPGPAPAPGPGPPSAQFGKVNGMDESVLMPEQGFSGRMVAHDDAHTHVADWQTEYGPKANLKSVEEICAKYPRNHWCMVNNYHVGHRAPRREKEKAFDPLDPEDHIKRVKDHVKDIKDWVTGGGDSGTTAEPYHERFKDVFRAPEGDGRTSSGSGKDGYSSDVPDVGKIEKAEEQRETPIFGSPGTPWSGARCWRQFLPWVLGLISFLCGC